jgi:hypothetical protein
MLHWNTSGKSLSTCIIISLNWQGLPSSMMRPLMEVLIPASDADTTGEHITDALSRSIRSTCERKGPPRTT